MPVVLAVRCSASGKIVVAVEQLISAGTNVPPLLNSTTQKRKGVLLMVASVAPAALVSIDNAAVAVTHTGSPFDTVLSRNEHRIGLVAEGVDPLLPLKVMVNLLEPTVAVIDKLLHASKPS